MQVYLLTRGNLQSSRPEILQEKLVHQDQQTEGLVRNIR